MAERAASSGESGPLDTIVRWLFGPAVPAWFLAFLRIFDTIFGAVDVLQAAGDSMSWLFRALPFTGFLATVAPYVNPILLAIVGFFQRAYELVFYVPLNWLFGLAHKEVSDFTKDLIVGGFSLLLITLHFAVRRHNAVRLAAKKQAEAEELATGANVGFFSGLGAGGIIGLILGGPIGAGIGLILGGATAEVVEGGQTKAAYREAAVAQLSIRDLRRGALYSIGATLLLLAVFFAARMFQQG